MARQVSDPQLAILAEVAGQLVAPDGYTEAEGASQVGFNKRSLAKLLEGGHLVRTDTTDPNTCGGRYRLHLTDLGRTQLRHAIERRLVPAEMFGRPLLEGVSAGVACCVINCKRAAAGTATDVLGPRDVCERCGHHFWGNFTAYRSAA